MIQALLFIKSDDPQRKKIENILINLEGDFPHEFHVIEIDRDPVLQDEFGEKTPVLDIGVFRLLHPFNESDIRYGFEKAVQRLKESQDRSNDVMTKRITQRLQMQKSDRFSRWFSNHYMVLLNMFTFLYLFFAFLAPVLMKVGVPGPAKVIYKVYSPLCHQLAFRSFFLFGEQPYYPR